MMHSVGVRIKSTSFGDDKDGSKMVKAIVAHSYQTNPVSLSEGFAGSNAGDFTITGGNCTVGESIEPAFQVGHKFRTHKSARHSAQSAAHLSRRVEDLRPFWP